MYYLISFLHCFLPCYEISLPTYYNMDWSKETHVIGLSGTLSDGWEGKRSVGKDILYGNANPRFFCVK